MRFAISRKREYLADAGSAEMTKNPLALASALRKISADPDIEAVKRDDVAQLFIQHPGKQAEGVLKRNERFVCDTSADWKAYSDSGTILMETRWIYY